MSSTSSHTESASRELTLEAFGAWLRNEPEWVEFCRPGDFVSQSCPLAKYTGAPCSYGGIGFGSIPHWATRFMDYFDGQRDYRKAASKAIALAALAKTEQDFLSDEKDLAP